MRVPGSAFCLLAGLLAACGPDDVEALPPMRRPSAEQRAGLPEVRGRWQFAGWEIPAGDTARVREEVYRLVPPGELRVLTQRLDSIAGQYGVPGSFVLPFTGEVRRDSTMLGVALAGEGVRQFFAGRVVRDTLWMETTSLTAWGSWPPGSRAAFARRVRGAPFTRLLGGRPLGPDSATLAAMRADSLLRDSLARAGQAPIAPEPAPRPAAREGEPRRAPPREQETFETPQWSVPDTPRRPVPPPEGPARWDTVPSAPPVLPDRRQQPLPQPVPAPTAPRDTIRFPGRG